MSDPVETISTDPAESAAGPAGTPADGGLIRRYVARHGRTTLLILAVIVAVGFLARAWFVVNPHSDPGDDALAYRALAESLYEDGSYGGPEFKSASDWSPGAPLLYAASYYLTGGVRDGVARGVEALFGTAAIVIAFLLTAHLIQRISTAGRRDASNTGDESRNRVVGADRRHASNTGDESRNRVVRAGRRDTSNTGDESRNGLSHPDHQPSPDDGDRLPEASDEGGSGGASDRFASAATPVSDVSPDPLPTTAPPTTDVSAAAIPSGPTATGRIAIAPLLAAALVAFYPPFIDSAGSLMSEPPAYFLLPAGLLAFFWAESRQGLWPWLLPGLLFGMTTLVRPEYMAVTAALGLLVLVRVGLTVGWKRSILAAVLFGLAALLPIVPWTIHNYVTLDRVVPISTGSGKALFTGTYLPGDGEYKRVKAELLFDQTGRRLDPESAALEAVDPVPLFTRVADDHYPELDRDAALGKVGRENFDHYLSSDPLGYLGMTVRKVGRMWGTSSGGVMSTGIGALIQKLLVLAGIAGLALLAWKRRWEAVALAIPILGITAIGALTLAPPRRNEILMTLVLPLAAVAFTAVIARLQSAESTT